MDRRPGDTRAEQIGRAAKALGVTVDQGPAERLRTAAAVLGAAEGVAMVEATAVAHGGADPMELVDQVAFRASRVRGPDPFTTHVLWTVWGVRRARTHLAGVLRRGTVDEEVVAASVLLDAVHALLSAAAHRAAGDAPTADACAGAARDGIAEATALVAARG